MSVEPSEISKDPIQMHTLPPDIFVRDGLETAEPGELLQQQGLNELSELVSTLSPCQGGVQDAPNGAIQDPAGSAIGSGLPPAGGGRAARSIRSSAI